MSKPVDVSQTPGRGESVSVVDSQQRRPGTDLEQCIHEMLRASCIWCTPRPGVEELDDDGAVTADRSRYTPDRWLSAAFYSTCPDCGAQIVPGDSIYRRSRQHFVCEECGDG